MEEKMRVLILEDNPDDFFLLKEVLESSDEIAAEGIHAQRLQTALDYTQNNSIDAALIDLQLPDRYGIDTFFAFHERFPAIPAIIVSGVEDLDTAVLAVQKGAQDYIHKGTSSSSAIIRTLRYAIERQRLLTNLEKTKSELQKSLEAAEAREREIKGLLKGARAVLEQTDFETTARKVFDISSEIIGAASGYVALLSEEGSENEVLFLEAGGLPCTVDPELPMPVRGLREKAYRTNSTVYDNAFMGSEWVQYLPEGHVPLENVMFAPLVLENKTVGVIGLANKKGDFTENDARMASGFGELAAIALQNSRHLDKREAAEKENLLLIQELIEALANVKQLSGLLPICMHCKKIKDDKGYWNQIEAYIHEHSDAKFSHSICRECAEKYYPDIDIYED